MSNTLIPKTKYSGNEWVNNIPGNWETKNIKYLFHESKEKVLAEGYNILSLTLNGIKIRNINSNEGQLPATFDNYKLVKKGYIVFNPMDLRRGFVDSSFFEGIISPAYIVLICNDSVDTNFYKYFFQWHYNDQIFYHMGRGVSEDHRWTLEEKILFNYKIVLPPTKTQVLIANYLDLKFDQIKTFIDNKKKLIKFLEEQKKTIIYDAVTKGLDKNIKTKPSGVEWLGDIPIDWNMKRLKYVSNTRVSNVDKKSEDENKVRLCNYNDVYKNEYITNDLNFMVATATKDQIEKFLLKKGDVIITKDSETADDMGVPAYVEVDNKDIVCGYHLAIITPDNSVLLGKYLFRLFETKLLRAYFEVNSNGVTRYGLDTYSTLNTPIILPPVPIQKLIIEYLDIEVSKINKIIKTIKQEIELIEEYKKSLIYHAVTGKIEKLLTN